MTYAKQREPELVPCDPNEIVEEVAQLVTDAAEARGIRVIVKTDPGFFRWCQLILKPFHRSLLNLVSNAMDACTEDEDTSKDFYIELSTQALDQDRFSIVVADNGCGMDEKTRSQLL